jgi:hypothetical protein
MQLRKKAQILTGKKRWQKQGVNLAVVYQKVKAKTKELILSLQRLKLSASR